MSAIVTVTLNPALDLTAEVDELIAYRKLHGRLVALDPGGGGVNVARVLRPFEVATLAVVPVGSVSGQALVVELGREGVPVVPVEAGADTRRSVTIWERSTREHFRILVDPEPLAPKAWQECLDAVDRADPPAYVVFSGSLPPGVAPAVVTEFAQRARRRGARFVCDSSGRALAEAVAAGADMIKPSRSTVALAARR
jgi:6-phosphofructokinase 2